MTVKLTPFPNLLLISYLLAMCSSISAALILSVIIFCQTFKEGPII